MKINLVYFLFGCLFGAYLALQKEPEVKQVAVQQSQQDCRVLVTKTKHKDGSVSENLEITAKQQQKQEIKPESGSYKPDFSLYAGIGTDLKGSVSFGYGKQLHQVMSNGTEHIYYFNYKLLEF